MNPGEKAVVFVDSRGKKHAATTTDVIVGPDINEIDLLYIHKHIVRAEYDVPKKTKKRKRRCWKAAAKLAPLIIALFSVLALSSVPASKVEKDADMRLSQQVTAKVAAQIEKDWEAKVFIASPNIVAKITTMSSPLNTNGQLIEEHILTYYDKGRMRYATNRFDRVKQ